MVSNQEFQEVLKKVNNQERRIRKLEKFVKTSEEPQEIQNKTPKEKTVETKKVRTLPKLTFTQVVTFLGIIGIVIGVISFFLYAVARHWIGETAQIMIGILAGFVLFGFAFALHKKREGWSNIVFGGSFFIEYIAIGVGVLGYKIMPDYLGAILAVLFLISSTFLSVNLKSRAIAYFTLIGGFLVPFITGLYTYDLFIMVFYTILSLGVVVLSFHENWPDLRFASFLVLGPILLFYIEKFSKAEIKAIPAIFLIVLFVIYHIAALINSLKDSKKSMSALDSIIIAGFTVIFLVIFYAMFDWTKAVYGLFVMIFSLIYLVEIWVFKSNKTKLSSSVVYSLLGTGIIALNLGFFFLTEIIDIEYLMVVFAVEYFIFSIISERSGERILYRAFSILSLIAIVIMYLFIHFGRNEILKSTILLIIYFCILLSLIYLFRKEINFRLNAAAFIIGGFLFIYSFSKYLLLFNIAQETIQIILSILWLIYTLVLFVHVETREGKWLVGTLLGITLLKIALKDLFYLEGVYRIIGFIIFGILLLIGGYLLNKNEKRK
ncbi:DUF2339 domain-containing protein [Candidatus Pacearchaeota archaeon]|nr:DUF2339 domain-containing protein [Candidatus Pacearchaeota archaeon]